MEIKEYATDGFINKDAFEDGHLIWCKDKNIKTMKVRYMTYRFKNFKYHMDHIHQEDYEN